MAKADNMTKVAVKPSEGAAENAQFERATGSARWWRQVKALTRKNFLLTWRLRRSTAAAT